MPQSSRSASDSQDYQWTKQTLVIALPALMGLLADPVLSMIDTGFVGRVGPIDLAALGVCSAETQEDKRQIAKISLPLGGILGTIVLLTLRLGGPALLTTVGVASDSPIFQPACHHMLARCWAAPAVVGIVMAEGAFRGNGDSKTPLVANSVAAVINLIFDPFLIFPMGMGMTGAAGVFSWRLWKRKLLPQPNDKETVKAKEVIKSILGEFLAMLTKQGSMLVFYTIAIALATRMGPAHVSTHQAALRLF